MKKTDIIKNAVRFVLIKKKEKKLYITVINVRMNQGYAWNNASRSFTNKRYNFVNLV